MALITRPGELAFVKILMTVPTGRIDRLVMALSVTSGTGNLLMLTFKFELAHLMVEKGNSPTGKACVAGVTGILFELTTMGCRVAETAIGIGIIITFSP